MVASAMPLLIVVLVVTSTILFALFSMRRVPVTPQEYIVGGRRFGAVFLWVLLAGEIYTSFTFLGAAGWAYAFGAPAFYIMAYGTVGFVFWYFFLPEIWRLGKERGLLTAPDFFTARYGSTALTTIVAAIYCIAIVPYVTIQLSALQIFLTIAGYGTINAQTGAIIAFLAIIAFVYVTGLRGTAWASIVKDTIVIGALIFAGIVIPVHFFGSPAGMFDRLLRAAPHHLTLNGWTTPKGVLWYISTVMLTGFGFFAGPQSIAATYSARDENVLRRNAMFMPVYQLVVVLVLFAGLSSLLIVPGLRGPAADQSFLVVVQHFYPPWVLGAIVAAGVLCALVPSTALLLSVASILAKNVVGDLFGIALEGRSQVVTTRGMVALVGLAALGLWLAYRTQLVDLLLLYYNGISQFMPGLVFGVAWKRVNAWSVGAGIIAGIAVALFYARPGIAPPFGLNPGFIGLVVNVAVVVIGTMMAGKQNNPDNTPVYRRAD